MVPRNKAGERCLVAALCEADTDHIGLCLMTPKLDAAIDNSHTAEWNDAPGRTKDEVIAALEKAAEMA